MPIPVIRLWYSYYFRSFRGPGIGANLGSGEGQILYYKGSGRGKSKGVNKSPLVWEQFIFLAGVGGEINLINGKESHGEIFVLVSL